MFKAMSLRLDNPFRQKVIAGSAATGYVRPFRKEVSLIDIEQYVTLLRTNSIRVEMVGALL